MATPSPETIAAITREIDALTGDFAPGRFRAPAVEVGRIIRRHGVEPKDYTAAIAAQRTV